MASSSRGNPAIGDILRTMVVIGALVFFLYLVGLFFTIEPEHPVSEADYLLAAEGVEPMAGFVPFVPTGLPEGSRVTSARFDTTSWYVGVVMPDEEFISLRQVELGEPDAIEDIEEGEDVNVSGVTWVQWAEDGDTSLSRIHDQTSVTVTATGSATDAVEFAESLVLFQSDSAE